MRKTLISIFIASMASMSAAAAEECAFDANTPSMPNPEEATEEIRTAKIQEIKEFQADLNTYRDCLTAIYENAELEKDVRQDALDAYNATIKRETRMVEAWQAFEKEYDQAGG